VVKKSSQAARELAFDAIRWLERGTHHARRASRCPAPGDTPRVEGPRVPAPAAGWPQRWCAARRAASRGWRRGD
jgi:hypothetical protein